MSVSFSHLGICVSDLDASLRFYCDGLGFTEVAAPKSFLVDKGNVLVDGEVARAHEWAMAVLESLLADATH